MDHWSVSLFFCRPRTWLSRYPPFFIELVHLFDLSSYYEWIPFGKNWNKPLNKDLQRWPNKSNKTFKTLLKIILRWTRMLAPFRPNGFLSFSAPLVQPFLLILMDVLQKIYMTGSLRLFFPNLVSHILWVYIPNFLARAWCWLNNNKYSKFHSEKVERAGSNGCGYGKSGSWSVPYRIESGSCVYIVIIMTMV